MDHAHWAVKIEKGPASLLGFSWSKTSQGGLCGSYHFMRRKALNTKSAHKQNEKEASIGTPDRREVFKVKAKVFLQFERKTS